MRETLHARTYFMVTDVANYASSVGATFQTRARAIGLRFVGTGNLDWSSAHAIVASANAVAAIIAAKQPDGVLCACGPTVAHGQSEAGDLVRALRRKGYSGPVVGSDALLTFAFITSAGAGAVESYGSEVGLDTHGASKAFQDAYRRRFHVPLQLYDALAYDAASIALNAIYHAATHGRLHGSLFQMRRAILPYVARVRWHGVTGLTTFDRNGDTTNRIVSIFTVRRGTWTYSGEAPRVGGALIPIADSAEGQGTHSHRRIAQVLQQARPVMESGGSAWDSQVGCPPPDFSPSAALLYGTSNNALIS